MKRIGAHVSTSGGVQHAPLNARKIGAKAFALFVKNQRQWKAKPLDRKSIDEFRENMVECGFSADNVLPHNSYLINLGNPESDKRKKSWEAFVDELDRCHQLGLRFLNIHPGSHLKAMDEDKCLNLIADCLNRALDKTEGVTIVLENTAGQGSNLGYRFEHLAYLIDRVEDKTRIGVCFDTCHAFAAGFDIRTKKSYERTMAQFERDIGFRYLKGVHLNDAKVELGSKKDRHQNIGKGLIGKNAFRFLMNDPRFEEIPMILETIDEQLWAKEIKMLYGFVRSS